MIVDVEALSALLSAAARDELLPRFRRVGHEFKVDGTFVTEADLAMQKRLTVELDEHYPGISLLGEEMSEAEQQSLLDSAWQGLWILDPLDGTSNYAAGIPFFSVSLALYKGGDVVLGVVYDPIHDELFVAEKGKGASLNGEPLVLSEDTLPLSKGIGLVDFKRLDSALASRLAAEPPYSSQRSLGSVALDWCQLAAGRVHAYLHGRQKIWDYAAGQLIFTEAGGYSCTLQGEPVPALMLTPRSAVAAPSRALFDEWCRYLNIDNS